MPSRNSLIILSHAGAADVIRRDVESFRPPNFEVEKAGRPVIRVLDLDGRLWELIIHGTEHGVTRWAPARGNGLLVCAETLRRITS